MKEYIFVTKKVKLEFDDQEISINELNINDIIEKYSSDYIIDRENYITTILGEYLVVSFKLKRK